MSEYNLRKSMVLGKPIKETFDFFADAANLEKITPPALQFRITTPQPIEIQEGTIIEYGLRLHGVPMNWKTLISEWDPPHSFTDEALKSPYALWIHKHTFKKLDENRTEIKDEVRYKLPFGPLGTLAHWYVRGELERIFEFRQQSVLELLGKG